MREWVPLLLLLLIFSPMTIILTPVEEARLRVQAPPSSGTWIVTSDETLTGTVILNGSVIVKADATLTITSATVLFNSTPDVVNITVEAGAKLIIENSKLNIYRGAGYRIIVYGTIIARNSIVQYAGVKDKDFPGILLKSQMAEFYNVTFSTSYKPIYAEGAKDVRIELCNFTAVDYPVTIEDSLNVTVKNSRFWNYDEYSIIVVNSTNVTLVGNKISKEAPYLETTFGIYIDGVLGLNLSSNVLYNTSIWLLGNETVFEKAVLSGNTVNGNPVALYFRAGNETIGGTFGEVIIAYSRNVSVASAIGASVEVISSEAVYVNRSQLGGGDFGVYLKEAKAVVYRNRIYNTTYVVVIENSTSVVYLNSFEAPTRGVKDDGAYVLDNGFYGNYWGFLEASFTDSDRDGINDQPLYWDPDTVDRYPLNSSQFLIDTLKPVLRILYPANNSWVTVPEVIIRFEAVDEPSGLKDVQYSLDGTTYESIGITNSLTLSVEEKEYTIYFKAIDNVNNERVVKLVFSVDYSKPSVAITSPSDSQVVKGSVVLIWDSSDNVSGIAKQEVILNEYVIAELPASIKIYEIDNLADGVHTLGVKVYDNAGNVNSAFITVISDTRPPEITLVSPSNWTVTSADRIEVSIMVYDEVSGIAGIYYSVNGSDWVFVANPSGFTVLLGGEGVYEIRIKASDRAGNSAEITVFVVIDRTPPSVRITYPENGSEFIFGSFEVVWEASDPHGISRIEIYINGSLYTVLGPEKIKAHINLETGTYVIKVRAYDSAGNYADAEATVKILGVAKKAPKEVEVKKVPWDLIALAIVAAFAVAFAGLYWWYRRR